MAYNRKAKFSKRNKFSKKKQKNFGTRKIKTKSKGRVKAGMNSNSPNRNTKSTVKNDSEKHEKKLKKMYEDMRKERIIWLHKAAKALESERHIAKPGSVRN